MFIVRWFCSKKIRVAWDFHKSILKSLHATEDLLTPEDVETVRSAAMNLRQTLLRGASLDEIETSVKTAEEATACIKGYPNATMRDIFEVALVAVAIALAARTFLIQPMKIPTGSMQPTLFGVTCENHREDPDFKVPGPIGRFIDKWVYGTSYCHLVAKCSGPLRQINPPEQVLPFIKKQQFLIGSQWHTLWFPPTTLPTYGTAVNYQAAVHSNVKIGDEFTVGEDVIKLKIKTGDHLFVNRLLYNFRRPKTGEIIIFETAGIKGLDQDTFYIKRMVADEGDTVTIGDDHHLILNGKRVDASTPNFEIVYGFDPKAPYVPNHYFGHVNAKTSRANGNYMSMLPEFEDANGVFTVPPDHALAMGDNTMNSSDSRAWGSFEREKIIGRAGFIYWPISERWGYGYR